MRSSGLQSRKLELPTWQVQLAKHCRIEQSKKSSILSDLYRKNVNLDEFRQTSICVYKLCNAIVIRGIWTTARNSQQNI
jgi:hypothetical protein